MQQGYRVYEMNGDDDVLHTYAIKGVDALILYMAAKQCNGPRLLLQVRNIDTLIPILTIGKTDEEGEQLWALNRGADDAVPASASTKLLLKRIELLLKKRDRVEAEEFQVGDFRLSTQTYQAYWREKPLNLTATEFELLKTLMQNRGSILPRLVLLNRVWGDAYTGGERIVDAHIKNLRHKLPEPLIKTVKGLGYEIEE
jgi:two-component system response regulator VanR